MRLLYFSPNYPPDIGGIETIAGLALPKLVERGYEIKVIASFGRESCPEHSVRDGVEVHRFPIHNLINQKRHNEILRVVKAVSELKRKFNPDCLHVNAADAGMLLADLTNSEDTPILAAIHNEFTDANASFIRQPVFAKIMRTAKQVTSVCMSALEQCAELYPEIRSKSSIIENALDIDEFAGSSREDQPPFVLCAGRMVPQKNFSTALKVFKDVVEELPDCRMVIAGAGVELGKLQELSRSLGIEKSVVFTGHVPREDMSKLLARSALLLITSLFEGGPILAMEAAAAGKPIVSFDVGVIARIVRHGKTGFVIKQGDVNGMKEQVVTLMKDSALRLRFGSGARSHVASTFSLERYVDDYDNLYRICVAGKRRQ